MKTYLQLIRPANIVTAVADILAGISLSGFVFSWQLDKVIEVGLLIAATKMLYAGGIVFNDVFDAELDAIERPERAIPSGKISKQTATIFGTVLLLIGILAASWYSVESGIFALVIALLALLYDKFGKHHSFFGPINMGLCRGVNILLGMSIIAEAPLHYWFLAWIPVIYIAAITMISRGEVHGGSKQMLTFGGTLYLIVSLSQAYFAYHFDNLLIALPLIGLHLYLILMPLYKAIQNPIGPNIGKAVKAGVLSLIVMDAAWVAVSGNLIMALVVLALLPLSMKLAKIFAVT